jgi:hypothetical protein
MVEFWWRSKTSWFPHPDRIISVNPRSMELKENLKIINGRVYFNKYSIEWNWILKSSCSVLLQKHTG